MFWNTSVSDFETTGVMVKTAVSLGPLRCLSLLLLLLLMQVDLLIGTRLWATGCLLLHQIKFYIFVFSFKLKFLKN